ncbi:MAG: class I SAM-dependent methyltransferase [Armatimonadetes bacterium]|nr:class I SAM-dependent methyltransferase [Armatimonadota bacterium]
MERSAGSDADSRQPAVMSADAESRFSFAKFAAHPFFKEVNAWLVARAGIRPGTDVVDLGCGPGAVTELILQRMGVPPLGRVFAIDPSASALVQAAQRIQSAIVRFIQGTAERINSLVPPVDTVIFCNAIHLVPDKAQVIGAIGKVLRPGGVLAFNTTFFDGAYPGDTYRFYKIWVLRAMRWLKERGYGVARGVKATAMQWLSPEEYRGLLQASGFDDAEFEFHEKRLACQAWEDISEFSMFIEGALPGVPLDVGAEALKIGVRQAFEELRLQSVPRIWMQTIARRT